MKNVQTEYHPKSVKGKNGLQPNVCGTSLYLAVKIKKDNMCGE